MPVYKWICLLGLLPSFALADCVILLHGMARTPGSMAPIEHALDDAGYHVVNLGYPSRSGTVEVLAAPAIENALALCPADQTVHVVTHSLGGILTRYYLAHKNIERLGRVVMLAPPNQGSQVVDKLRKMPGFTLFNGPAGEQLGTGDDSILNQLEDVSFELGVIAGTRTVNPILSQFLPNPDDGKVSLENTKVAGMKDFVSVPKSHTFLMRSELVITQVIHFLENGAFDHTDTVH